jgi:DNA-binding transcriptional LysR family regulator
MPQWARLVLAVRQSYSDHCAAIFHFCTPMEWDDIKHFLAVARSGSLTDAARELKSSAATVGRRVAELETKLGARLFDRSQAGYSLTECGEAVRLKAEDIEESVLAIEREAGGRDRRATGRVRLATTDDMAAYLVAPRLADFRRDYPGISLAIVSRLDLANLTRRDADIALRGARPQHGDYVVRRVGRVDFAVYASKAYAQARGLAPDLKDFSRIDVITWTEEWAHLRGGPWFANHAPRAPVALAANSTRLHHAACRAGVGVTILPCFAGEADCELICLVPPERVLSVDLWLVVNRDLSRTARVRAVMDFVAGLGPSLTGGARS